MEINNTTSSSFSSPPPSSPLHPPAGGPQFTMPDMDTDMDMDETPLPVYTHQQLTGSKCGHYLQPFQSPHTPNCDFCVMTFANAKLKSTLGALQHEHNRAILHGRNIHWNKARLAFLRASTAFNRVMLSIARRNDRKKAWDEAHIRIIPISTAVCFACTSFNSTGNENDADLVETQVDKSTAWWEVPGALVPLRNRTRKTIPPWRRNGPVLTTGSAFMRDIIRAERVQLRADQEEAIRDEDVLRIESAFRRKHRLPTRRIASVFFEQPLDVITSRKKYLALLVRRRALARQKRKYRLPAPPGESPLRKVKGVDEVSDDSSSDEDVSMWLKEARKMNRLVKEVAEEVGYLYFVGCDGEDWKEDYFTSDCNLVKRDREPEYGHDDDDMVD